MKFWPGRRRCDFYRERDRRGFPAVTTHGNAGLKPPGETDTSHGMASKGGGGGTKGSRGRVKGRRQQRDEAEKIALREGLDRVNFYDPPHRAAHVDYYNTAGAPNMYRVCSF